MATEGMIKIDSRSEETYTATAPPQSIRSVQNMICEIYFIIYDVSVEPCFRESNDVRRL